MRRAILVIVLLIAIGVIVLWLLTRTPPTWYEPPDAASPAVQQLADRVEYRLVQEAHKPRPPEDDDWTLRIREEQINAWLAARLEKWVAHEGGRWPEALDPPQVRLQSEGIDLAIGFRGELSRVLVARLVPQMDHGLLRLTIQSIALGRLRLPGEPLAHLLQWLSDHAPEALDQQVIASLIGALQQREGIDPLLHLEDGRRIRLLDVRVDEGMIDLTARTIDGE